MEKQLNWPALLDELKCKESLSSDSQIATALGVSPSYICAVRKGRKGVSLELAKDILARLGRNFEDEYIESLFIPTKVRRHREYIADMRRQVILRTNGNCQLCGNEAPFKGRDDLPYLEVHHVVPLYDGGSDVISNLVALCPNCHRMVEICPNSETQDKLKKLVSENV